MNDFETSEPVVVPASAPVAQPGSSTGNRKAMSARLEPEFLARHGLRPSLEWSGEHALAVGNWHAQTVFYGLLSTVLFSIVSGDWNRAHYCTPKQAARGPLGGYAVPGLLLSSSFSGVLASSLPGPGTIYAGQTLRFMRPARLYRKYIALLKVSAVEPARHRIVLDCVIDEPVRQTNSRLPVCSGQADVRNYSAALFS